MDGQLPTCAMEMVQLEEVTTNHTITACTWLHGRVPLGAHGRRVDVTAPSEAKLGSYGIPPNSMASEAGGNGLCPRNLWRNVTHMNCEMLVLLMIHLGWQNVITIVIDTPVVDNVVWFILIVTSFQTHSLSNQYLATRLQLQWLAITYSDNILLNNMLLLHSLVLLQDVASRLAMNGNEKNRQLQQLFSCQSHFMNLHAW